MSNNVTCRNCGRQITCGCQYRTASNGVQVCDNCIGNYEKQLLLIKSVQIKKD